jgi:hypothetical protein
MKRVLVIAASAMSLTACSSLPSWMQFDLGKSVPAATTMQFESEPAGAEARTSLGQTCRTPCSIGVNASDFTVTFALAGYQPQTVPVRLVASTDSNRDPNSEVEGPRLVPNPVFVQLQPAAPPPVAHKKPPPPKKKPRAAPKPAPTAMAPEPAPAPAPASPWPPPR